MLRCHRTGSPRTPFLALSPRTLLFNFLNVVKRWLSLTFTCMKWEQVQSSPGSGRYLHSCQSSTQIILINNCPGWLIIVKYSLSLSDAQRSLSQAQGWLSYLSYCKWGLKNAEGRHSWEKVPKRKRSRNVRVCISHELKSSHKFCVNFKSWPVGVQGGPRPID